MHIPAMSFSDFPVVPISHGTFLRQYSIRYSPENMMFSNIQKLLRDVFRSSRSTSTVQQVEQLPDSPARAYLLRMPNGSEYVLACPPEAGTRLLSHELDALDAEASVLSVIASQANVPVPRLISQSSRNSNLGGPFLLRTSVKGTRLSDMAARLSPSERAHIDRTVGSFVRRISLVSGSSFGPSHAVLAGQGSASWSAAFRQLMEAALRDGEDALVSVPYRNIRLYCERYAHVLDGVRVPQLLAYEMGMPQNVIVDEHSKQVTGLVGFGHVIWGDPMLAEVFADPGESFWEGYRECPMRAGPEGIRQLL